MSCQALFAKAFQSTLPVRGATRRAWPNCGRELHFNPRSPCGERRQSEHFRRSGNLKISIHAPRAGSDLYHIFLYSQVFPFQSTLPVRGATVSRLYNGASLSFQSTLPVRGATVRAQKYYYFGKISIHAPRAGSDTSFAQKIRSCLIFQSTLPVRGATHKLGTVWILEDDFNPRSPCGERL